MKESIQKIGFFITNKIAEFTYLLNIYFIWTIGLSGRIITKENIFIQ
jgi:hypothetical protein